MSDDAEDRPPKSRKGLFLIMAALLSLVGGGGGYLAVAGLPVSEEEPKVVEKPLNQASVGFIQIEPIIVPLESVSDRRALRFGAHLEVPHSRMDEVAEMMPRIKDVLNTYLRAIEASALEDRRALLRLRAQMLRRIKVVTSEDAVHDLLITEFVIN